MATLLSLRELKETEIYDREGNKLGAIDDLMLDMDESCVAYVVLLFGTRLGTPNKRFAVPVGALTLDTENECFVIDIDKADLAQADGYDPAAPPTTADPRFAEARPPRLGLVPGTTES